MPVEHGIFAEGLDSPEAPVALPDGSWLVAEMGPARGCITRLSPDGREKTVVAKTGRPNGLVVDAAGTIWVAEADRRALVRCTLNGEWEVVLTACGERDFLFPNDLCFGPDGLLYMTDSGMTGRLAPNNVPRDDWRDLQIEGALYRIDVSDGRCELLDESLRFTNGIAFDADGVLYVAETLTGLVYRYEVGADGRIGPRERFADVVDRSQPEGLRGPDGMAFDTEGRLYVAVVFGGSIAVVDDNGGVEDRFPAGGAMPTNLAFGPDGRLYVTELERGEVTWYAVDKTGLPLRGGPPATG